MLSAGGDLLDDLIGKDLETSMTVQWTSFNGDKGFNTSDPSNLQAILATQFKDFEAGSWRYNVFKPVLGRSIFSSDGSFWEHSRGLFRPQFARENINDLDTTDKACTALITAIGSTKADGWTAGTETLPLFYNFTLDTATDFLFGESIESQQVAIAAKHSSSVDVEKVKTKLEDAQRFKDSLQVINQTLFARINLQSLWWLGDGPKFRKAVRYIRAFTEQFVQLACEHGSQAEKPQSKKQSLLHNLATQTQDREELRNQTLAILVAGRDTTASVLGWCLERLALHPEIFNKLRGAVLENFDLNKPITFESLKSCRYLQHFLNEVLRLHPVVPINSRAAARDTTLPTGGGPDQRSPIAVRKGQIILFSVYNLHRREELWGPDAAEFKPERWEQKIPAWQFLPFLGGPRTCLGQQFALTEAGTYSNVEYCFSVFRVPQTQLHGLTNI